jgi:hypothetical protein
VDTISALTEAVHSAALRGVTYLETGQ